MSDSKNLPRFSGESVKNMELRQWQRQQGDMRRSMYGGRVG